MIKKITGLFLAASVSFFLAAEPVCRLRNVKFDSKGSTDANLLDRKMQPSIGKREFSSVDELYSCLEDIEQLLENLRLLEEIECSVETTVEDDVYLVDATYSFTDSHSLIVFPKPKIDSNTGAEIRLKLKDDNFAGRMSSLEAEVAMMWGNEDDPDDYSILTPDVGFFYNLPFTAGKTNNIWMNDWHFSWEIGDSKPEYDFYTGLQVGLPFSKGEIQFIAGQNFIREKDFEEYGDDNYFVESAKIRVPLIAGYFGNTTQIKYIPSVDCTYNWDKDGIDSENRRLNKNPLLKAGHEIEIARIDWVGTNRLRTGYSFKAGNFFGWNFRGSRYRDNMMPSLEGEIMLMKSFGFAGLEFCLTGFAGMNSTEMVGGKIRGALDKQKYSKKYSVDRDNFALETDAFAAINLNFPIHIMTTHWIDWKFPHIFEYLEFEAQLCPFFDAALLRNRATGNSFSMREGIYTAGIEARVYPLHWKSLVVRASYGIELDKIFKTDTDWRDPKKKNELFIGLGLQF